MKLFRKYIEADGNLSRSPTDETDDTSSMDETSTLWKRKLETTSPNQVNGLSLELSLGLIGHVDMGESSRKKRQLTTTSPNYPLEYFRKPFGDIDMGESSPKKRELTTTSSNQVNGLSLELSLGPNGHVDMGESSRKKRKLSPNQEDDAFYRVELSVEIRSPPNDQENGLSLGLPTASSTQQDQDQPAAMQNPNQEDALSLGLPTASSTQQDQPPTRQNPNQEDALSLALPLSSSTQLENQPAMQNPNQEEEEEEVEEEEQQEQEQQQEEEEEEVKQEEEEEEEQQQQEAPAPAPGPGPGPGPIPIFMFEKRLTSSDVGRNHNRLLISGRMNDLVASLTNEERRRVESNGRGDFVRVVTMTAHNHGVEYILHLKRWAGSGALVLKHEWGKLVRANRLRIGILLWDGDFA